jgi:phosphatidate cytidylyltransferase
MAQKTATKATKRATETIDEKMDTLVHPEKHVPPTEREKKKQDFVVRAFWTVVMFSFFVGVICAGHIWTVGLILICQITVFKECIAVTSQPSKEKNLRLTKSLNWYLLFTTIYYLDGESFILNFNHLIFTDQFLTPLATHHRFISYWLYILGLVFFVATLQKGHLKFQFAQLCITHMVLLLTVFQAHLIINNIFNGMIWFLMPVLMVITNDIFAYLCGITFGKTQLIAISPKKTLEGFVGAWVFTSLAGILLAKILSDYDYLICPVKDLKESVFSHLTCDVNPIFLPQDYRIPPIIAESLGVDKLTIKPIYFHSLNLASFASLIAPFGGFFASGLKRTFNVKDFGHSIPGHGGITDRIDCQFLMGSFAYLYYETFLSTNRFQVGSVLQLIVTNLEPQDIVELIKKLHLYLYNIGILEQKTYDRLLQLL